MAERAKLRYHDKAYYDEDMIAIAKKELNFNGLKFVGYKLDREKHLLLAQGYRTNKKDIEVISIPYGALAMYNVGKSLSDLIIDGIAYDREKLMMVGQEVASLWGASCIKYHVDKKNKVVMFECIEHGEEFVTSIEFSKLKEYL